jgi:hypothetical protein
LGVNIVAQKPPIFPHITYKAQKYRLCVSLYFPLNTGTPHSEPTNDRNAVLVNLEKAGICGHGVLNKSTQG